MRLSGRNLNYIRTALTHRNAILKDILSSDEPLPKNESNDYPFGEDVKIIHQHKLNCKLLTPTEKDGVVTKYKCGMTMAAIADEYGCHYTTIGRILRQKGVEIRDPHSKVD